MRETAPVSRGEQGFTLIELMISLGLFALIAVAGLAMVDGILRVQTGTEGRMDQLAQLQRTVSLVTSDLDQVAAGRIRGTGADLSFTRAGPGSGGPPVEVHYALAGGTIVRQAGLMPQPLLPGTTGLRWSFRDGGAWIDHWPATEEKEDLDRWPRAIAMEATTPQGTLRRIVQLPVRADELNGVTP